MRRNMMAGLLVMAASGRAGAEERFEVGAFVGRDRFHGAHELGNAAYSDQVPLDATMLGARARLYLVHGLSIELETKVSSSGTAGDPDAGRHSLTGRVLGARLHATYQLSGWGRVRPFAALGLGTETLFIDAPGDYLVESDTDPNVHWGAGAHVAVGRDYGLRFDARQSMTAGRHSAATFGYEATIGLYMSFGGGPVPTSPTDEPADPLELAARAQPRLAPRPRTEQPLHRRPLSRPAPIDTPIVLASLSLPSALPIREPREDHQLALLATLDEDAIADTPNEQVARVRFKKNRARVRRAFRAKLDAVVARIREQTDSRILIAGHADGQGSEAYNLELSRVRADRVKAYLVRRGIDSERIETIGYGETRPVASNDDPVGRAHNRRIELYLDD